MRNKRKAASHTPRHGWRWPHLTSCFGSVIGIWRITRTRQLSAGPTHDHPCWLTCTLSPAMRLSSHLSAVWGLSACHIRARDPR